MVLQGVLGTAKKLAGCTKQNQTSGHPPPQHRELGSALRGMCKCTESAAQRHIIHPWSCALPMHCDSPVSLKCGADGPGSAPPTCCAKRRPGHARLDWSSRLPGSVWPRTRYHHFGARPQAAALCQCRFAHGRRDQLQVLVSSAPAMVVSLGCRRGVGARVLALVPALPRKAAPRPNDPVVQGVPVHIQARCRSHDRP